VDITRTIILSVSVYFFALFLTRLTGRKVISHMTFFDFVMGVTIGSVISNSVLDDNGPFPSLIMLGTISALTILMGFLYIKSNMFRKAANAEPVIVIDRGQFVNQNLTRIRLSINDLMMMLRQKNFFNVSDVEYAILESNGQLSVLAKAEKRPVALVDLDIQSKYMGIPKDLVIDGNILEKNLNNFNINKADLLRQLRNAGASDTKDVFYAGIDTNGELYVSMKQK